MADPFSTQRPLPPRMASRSSLKTAEAPSPQSVRSTTFQNGYPSPSPSMDNFAFASGTNTPSTLLSRLETLLVSKSEEIQLAGRLGESLLSQQAELERKIQELEQALPLDQERADLQDAPDISDQVKHKLEALENDMRQWDADNDVFYAQIGLSSSVARGHGDAEDIDLKSQQASRRAKRDQLSSSRANDIEFATEIGQSLLTEVRRLQALLQERDEHIAEAAREKESLAASLESKSIALRSVEEVVDRYKEENWNLEVTLQELKATHTELASTSSKTEAERQKLVKSLAASRSDAESQRQEIERLNRAVEDAHAKRELDLAEMRKGLAGLQRDKSDLQSHLDRANGELSKAIAKRSISGQIAKSRSGQALDALSPSKGGEEAYEETEAPEDEDDVFGAPPASVRRPRPGDGLALLSAHDDFFSSDGETPTPDGSPAVQRDRSRYLESASKDQNDLRSKLAHANKTIVTLRNALAREKTRKGGEAEEDEEDESEADSPVKTRQAASRGGRRGRGRRGAFHGGVRSNLGVVVSNEWQDEDGSDADNSIIDHGDVAELHSDEAPEASGKPRTRFTPSLASLEGMDPAFANISGLDASARALDVSDTSLRPSSSMFNTSLPDILKNEPTLIETLEVGCQTEPIEPIVRVDVQEKIVYVPQIQERIVEKIVEVPKIEERIVHVPQIQEKIVDRLVEVPRIEERIVEKIVEVEVPKIEERIVYVPQIEERVVEKTVEVEKIVHVPTIEERIVEKIVEVEKRVEVPVDRVVEVEKIVHVPTIEERIVEKIVEVEKRVEVPVDRVVEVDKIVHVPTIEERIVEKFIEVPKIEEKIVHVDRAVEVPVEKVVEKIVYLPAPTPDTTHMSSQTDPQVTKASSIKGRREIAKQNNRLSQIEGLRRHPGAQLWNDAASIASTDEGFVTGLDGDTETDFEDAQETIGTRTPAMTLTPTQSVSEFYSLRDHSPSTPRNERRNSYFATALLQKPETFEQGCQTDPLPEPERLPEPISLPALRSERFSQDEGRRDSQSSNQTFGVLDPNAAPGLRSSVMTIIPKTRDAPSGPVYLQAIPSTQSLVHSKRVSAISSMTTDTTSSAASNDAGLPQKPREPPVLTMPPPPSFPPPPRSPTKARQSDAGLRPPRPLSPAPADMLQRAQSPIGDVLSSPNPFAATPSYSTLRGHLDPYDNMPHSSKSTRRSKAPSFASRASAHSRGQSIDSAHTSDGGFRYDDVPLPGQEQQGTDPSVIQAITQTMIGEYMYKYTRRMLGSGISEKRHRRFFWVHPYTRTLYWSVVDPGSARVNQSNSKGVFIQGAREVHDPNTSPAGLYPYSIIVETPDREIKITAPTAERHRLWFDAINYLMNRQDEDGGSPPSHNNSPRSMATRGSIKRKLSNASLAGFGRKKLYSHASASESRLAPSKPRARLSTATMLDQKRPGTPAAEFEARYASPRSVRSRAGSTLHSLDTAEYADIDDAIDFVEDDDDDDARDGYEGLENVRVCCGEHDVGHLSHRRHHHRSHSKASSVLRPTSPYGQEEMGVIGKDSVSVASTSARRGRASLSGLFNPSASPSKSSRR